MLKCLIWCQKHENELWKLLFLGQDAVCTQKVLLCVPVSCSTEERRRYFCGHTVDTYSTGKYMILKEQFTQKLKWALSCHLLTNSSSGRVQEVLKTHYEHPVFRSTPLRNQKMIVWCAGVVLGSELWRGSAPDENKHICMHFLDKYNVFNPPAKSSFYYTTISIL